MNATTFVALLSTCCLGVASTFAQTAQPITRPQLTVGDNWTFRFMSLAPTQWQRVVRYRVEAVSSESVRMVIESVSHSNEPPSLATFSPDLNATTVGAATFSPFFARLRFPLNVGDQWIATHTSSNKARTINHEVRAVASAWDSLALPKSPLQCIRVEVTDTFVAPPQGLTIVGRESNCYSPLAKYIVKAERVESDVSGKIYNHSMWELTDFEVK